jgi:PTS system nitrogen regulatory IIA component
MNPIGELIAVEDIRLDLDVADTAQLLDVIAGLLASRNGPPHALVLESLTVREELGSTGVGHGVAIPHARMNRCATPAAAFVRTRVAIPFDAPDGRPVSVFLGLIVPDTATDRHLKLLATAAAMFSDRSFRERLKAADSAATLRELLVTWTEAVARAP